LSFKSVTDIVFQSAEIDGLKARVKQFGDYDEIKRELEIMKVSPAIDGQTTFVLNAGEQYVEFSGADFDNDDDQPALPSPSPLSNNTQLGRSLENLLVSKNRRLLEDLTKLRVSWEDLNMSFGKSEESVESLTVEVGRLKGLNEKLENDLMGLNKEAEGFKVGGGTSGAGLAGLDIGGKVVCLSIFPFPIKLTIPGWPINTLQRRCVHPTHRNLST
jgi:homeobox protein cut-like